MHSFCRLFSKTEILLVTIIGMVGTAVLAVRLGMDFGPDLVNYHFYAAWQALDITRLTSNIFASNIQGYLNPYAYVPYYLAYKFLPPIGVGILFGALHGLCLVSAYVLARVCFANWQGNTGKLLAFGCALFGMISPFFISLTGASWSDNLTPPLVLLPLAAILAVRYRDRGQEPEVNAHGYWLLAIAGLCLGVSVGLKMVNCMFVLALAPAWLWRWRFSKEDFLTAAITILGVVIGFLLVNGYWMWLLWTHFKSPMFPFYNGFFKSDMIGDIWTNTPALAAADNFYEALVYPFRWVMGKAQDTEWDFRDYRYAYIYVLIGLIVLRKLMQVARIAFAQQPVIADSTPDHVNDRWWFLGIWTLATYAFWMDQFGAMRYLMPVTLVTGILLVMCLSALLQNRVLMLGLTAVMAVVAIWTIDVPPFGRVAWNKPWYPVQLPEPLASKPALYLNEGVIFIAPFFPKGTRFVGQGYLAFRDDGINRLAHEEVANYQGDMRTLTTYRWNENSENLIKSFGVWRDQSDCVYFNVSGFDYESCKLQRLPRIQKAAPLSLPAHVNFAQFRNPSLNYVTGLGGAEPGGSWTDGSKTIIKMAGALPRRFRLLLSAHAYEPNIDAPIKITVGGKTRQVTFGRDPSKKSLSFEFAAHESPGDTITIEVPHPTMPMSREAYSYDRRQLGVQLSSLSIVSPDDAQLSWPADIDFARVDQELRVIGLSGFSSQEATGRWTEGPRASVQFVNELPRQFSLVVRANAFGPNGVEPVTVKVGGQSYQINPTDQFRDMTVMVDLPAKAAAADRIEFEIPKPTAPSEISESGDRRKLGIFLQRLVVMSSRPNNCK